MYTTAICFSIILYYEWYQEIRAILEETIASHPFEDAIEMVPDMEDMLGVLEELGINPNDPYYQEVARNATYMPACVNCAGVLGEMAAANIRQYMPERLHAMVEWQRGRIMYYPEILALTLPVEVMAESETLRRNVVSFIGHERRHALQPEEVVDIQVHDLSDYNAYMAQRHERDAYAFQMAIIDGRASLEDVATYPWVA